MREPMARTDALPPDLIERCLHDPLLRAAVERHLHGEWTLEHAMTHAAILLSRDLERMRERLVEAISRLPKAKEPR